MGKLKVDKNAKDWAPFVLRDEWGAKPQAVMDAWHLTQLPVSHIWFSYEDLLTKYQTLEHATALQMCQKEHMAAGFYDIKYNFLVSPEGVIYEGRGWFDEPHLPEKIADLKYKCMNIVYMGDYSTKDPPYPAVKNGVKLIMYGLRRLYLNVNFKVIPFREPVE